MDLLNKTDEEIIQIANPIWDNLIKTSNQKDYGGFTRDFSSQMLFGANEVELGKQWANNKILTSLSDKKEVLGCLRRNLHVTVLYRQTRYDRVYKPCSGRRDPRPRLLRHKYRIRWQRRD